MFGFFLAWLLGEALHGYLLCQAVTQTVPSEGICARAPCKKNGVALGFCICGPVWEMVVKQTIAAQS